MKGNGMIYESVDFPIFALNPIDSLSVAAYNQIMNVCTLTHLMNMKGKA